MVENRPAPSDRRCQSHTSHHPRGSGSAPWAHHSGTNGRERGTSHEAGAVAGRGRSDALQLRRGNGGTSGNGCHASVATVRATEWKWCVSPGGTRDFGGCVRGGKWGGGVGRTVTQPPTKSDCPTRVFCQRQVWPDGTRANAR